MKRLLVFVVMAMPTLFAQDDTGEFPDMTDPFTFFTRTVRALPETPIVQIDPLQHSVEGFAEQTYSIFFEKGTMNRYHLARYIYTIQRERDFLRLKEITLVRPEGRPANVDLWCAQMVFAYRRTGDPQVPDCLGAWKALSEKFALVREGHYVTITKFALGPGRTRFEGEVEGVATLDILIREMGKSAEIDLAQTGVEFIVPTSESPLRWHYSFRVVFSEQPSLPRDGKFEELAAIWETEINPSWQKPGEPVGIHSKPVSVCSKPVSICFVLEMDYIPELQSWPGCSRDAYPEETQKVMARWQTICPWVQSQVTPQLVKSLSLWAKAQMEGYRVVAPLENVQFSPVSANVEQGKIVFEGAAEALPSHHPLVTRWLELFLVYDSTTGDIIRVTVTIRGELLE